MHDALVDDHKSDLGPLCSLIVEGCASLLELADFAVDDLSALAGTNSISHDDDISWLLTTMVFGEGFNAILETFFQLGVNNFLAFSLNNIVAVVLRHLFVS